MTLPIFDHAVIPRLVKVLFSFCVTYAFFPFIKGFVIQDLYSVGLHNVWALALFYSLTGLAIGFLAKIILQIFNSAGSIITQQIGFSSIRYFDLTVTDQVGPFERLISFVMIVIIVSSGGLLPLFKGGFVSFQSMNFNNVINMNNWMAIFADFFRAIFKSSIILSIPLIFSNILVMVILGIISRMIPQMNVLMVSFVLNIGVGLIIFFFNSEEFFNVGLSFYSGLLGRWLAFIG